MTTSTDDKALESISEKTHFYHDEEYCGNILSASYNPKAHSVKVITERDSYIEFL